MTTNKKREIATSFTTLTFLVIAISGVMMFFHISGMQVKALHNILGLVFVVAGIFHVIVNWKSMKNYFSKKVFISATIAISIVSAALIYASSNQGENPKMLIMQGMINTPVKNSFQVLNVKYEDAIKKLESKNIRVLDSKSINDIAKANQTSPYKIVKIITSK
ncbi:DUF4405 domain-containing protein [Arcobacter sp. LA11]|uniref:DUF4405 domain-containing protein n=1 Tax=Arcobacter sp. LA11 TaxID=1898176 RepID=UPI0009331C6D|nr:DUF4405 domain-containing protein [Arcobacter sp. LA11]